MKNIQNLFGSAQNLEFSSKNYDAHIAKPASKYGGDAYRIQETNDGTVHALLIDVSGHDKKADKVAQDIIKYSKGKLTESLNENKRKDFLRGIHDMLEAGEDYVTGNFISLDENGKYQLNNFGHQNPVFYNKNGQEKSHSNNGTMALGFFGFDHETHEGTLEKGESIFYRTDGIDDIMEDPRETVNVATSIMQNNPNIKPQDFVDQMYDAVKGPYQDDVTVAMIRRK